VNVPDGAGFEALRDRDFNFICAGPFAMENQPVVAIRLKREREAPQLFGKPVRSGERFTCVCMNENRAGRGIFIQSGKGVESEKQPLVFTDTKLFQARAARAVAGCCL